LIAVTLAGAFTVMHDPEGNVFCVTSTSTLTGI
jgi:hypothetical protein